MAPDELKPGRSGRADLGVPQSDGCLCGPRRADPGGHRLQSHAAARRGAWVGGRVRLRQIDHCARHHASPGRRRPNRRRSDPVPGPRYLDHERRGVAPHSRRRHRHDLPRADGIAESLHDHRRAADRSAHVPRGRDSGRGPGSRTGDARASAPRRRRAHDGLLSASDLRRPAAAHRHRDGVAVESPAAVAGRADHRSRRHRGGGNRRSHPRHLGRIRHLHALHLAQFGIGARDLRSHHGDVLRAGGGERADRDSVSQHAPSLHPGPVCRHTRARHGQEHAPAGRDSGAVAVGRRPAAGLRLRTALRLFRCRTLRRRRGRDASRRLRCGACVALPAGCRDRLERTARSRPAQKRRRLRSTDSRGQ